jgi:opacity protein-like surface antigen
MIKKAVTSSLILLCASSTTFARTTSYVGAGLAVGGYSNPAYYGYYQNSGFYGASANAFAGKGKFVDKEEKIYVGAELGGTFSHGTSGSNAAGLNASVIPGLMVTDSTMLYGRVGAAASVGNHNLVFGPMVGVGVQTNVKKNWDIRTEYTNYSSSNSSQIGAALVYKLE